MEKSELIKSIPLKQILAISEVRLRDLDKSYMEMLRGLCEQEDQTNTVIIPPIEVFLLQSGDPDTAVYPIADGLHRYTVQKEMKRKFIRAIVNDKKFTTEDTGSKSLHCELTFSCMAGNAKNPQAFTMQQRKDAVIKCFVEYAASIERIHATGIASLTSIYEWLRPYTQKSKQEAKSLIAEKVLELRSTGKSEREIAKVLQADKSVASLLPETPEAQRKHINRVLHNGVGLLGQNSAAEFCPNKNTVHGTQKSDTVSRSEPPKRHEPGIDEAVYVEEVMADLCNVIQGAKHSEHLEDRLRNQFLPKLRDLCPTIEHLLDQGDFTEISGLKAEYYALYEQVKLKNIEIVRLKDEKTALVAKLAEKTNNCNDDCPHTYARLRTEKNRFHHFILARAKQFADLMPHHSPDTQKIIKNLAFEFILPAISMFESAAEHGANLTTSDTISQFAEFDNLLKSSHLTNQLINKRLQQLRISFEALGSMQSCQNNKMQVTS